MYICCIIKTDSTFNNFEFIFDLPRSDLLSPTPMTFSALTLIKYVLPQDTFSNEMKVEFVVITLLATSESEAVTM